MSWSKVSVALSSGEESWRRRAWSRRLWSSMYFDIVEVFGNMFGAVMMHILAGGRWHDVGGEVEKSRVSNVKEKAAMIAKILALKGSQPWQWRWGRKHSETKI
jgi:hypothetical protein